MHRESPCKSIAIVGAGITGLTAACLLRRRGHRVHVFERNAVPGGAIQSNRVDGYLVEAGPNTMLLNDQAVLDFFHTLGLKDELIEASPHAKNRFIVRDRKPVAAPMSPAAFVRTPLLSGRAKLRLLAEPFIRRGDPPLEESVAAFACRRLGQEAVDYAINPLIGGIYAGDPEKLATCHAFPTLHRFEAEKGSLLRGALAAGRARKKSGQPKFKARSISFRAGLHEIIDALDREIGDSLYTKTQITTIEPGSKWRVGFAADGESETTIEVDAVVITVPGYAAAALPVASKDGSSLLTGLDKITYPPVTSVALGFHRSHIRHPLDGYGMLVPQCESLHILGTLFSSSLFPGRAPDGHVLLTTFVGGVRQPALASLPDDQLRETILEDLRPLLGISGESVFMQVTRWSRAIPQYDTGYGRFHRIMETAEKELPGLYIGGHIRDGVSVGDCIRAGMKLADRAGR